MKRFQYSLDTVLTYQTHVLDHLRTEHARIISDVHRKQGEINSLKVELNDFHQHFDQAKTTGAAIEDYRLFGMCIEGMERKIDTEKEHLLLLQQKEEAKKNEVVDAKVDTSRYEKLKLRRLSEYRKAELKAEETFAEEFVTRTLTRAEYRDSQNI
ncbi:MAG: flagellar FliJ family protein [Lachnospiraceae bacterium]